MNFEQFQQLAESYSAIPVYRELLSDTLTPVSLFLKLREKTSHPFLFESVEGGEHLARYSFIGVNPYQILSYKDGEVSLRKRDEEPEQLNEKYFEALKRLTQEYSEPELPELPRLRGGAVGYSSYDTIREVEELPNIPEDNLHLPEAMWGFYDQIIAFDHVKHRVVLIKTVLIDSKRALKNQYNEALEILDELQELIGEQHYYSGKIAITSEVESNTEPKEFSEMVEKARSYIYEGDIFQVVLSQRFGVDFEGDRFMLYRALRAVNPSPYLFYLDFDEFALIGSSPEVLVRVQNQVAEVLPIAGTRKRGKDEAEDKALEEDLLADPKEMAEHVMLVDLGRNDLSRICEPGSVTVDRSTYIERYSHVMHIVSDVSGDLDKNMNCVDALMNCFPAGTVSGAPKVRAMQIIDELEKNKRGPYAGAVGYFDFSGNMDTCIAIRTMVATNNQVFIQAGAGIVADSDPEKEYEETVNKAKALVEALRTAGKMTV
jgi:anthranilate synthase component 1